MTAKRFTTKSLVILGVLSALVLVTSMISFPLGDLTRFHLGNIMCLLSGILFGPFVGGLSAGIGSMLYDFTNPLFMPEFWITFIMKFAMAFAAGMLARKLPQRTPVVLRYGIPSFVGAALYMALFLTKSAIWQHFITGNPWQAVWPTVGWLAVVSTITGSISILATTLLAPVVSAALHRAHVFPHQSGHAAG